jgi:glycosyltransferase involved in cell wall biosynthesis
MLNVKPTVLAKVSQDTRQVSEALAARARPTAPPQSTAAPPVRVLLIAPSLDIIGGQSIQASQLLQNLTNEPSVCIRFLKVNPRLPAPLSMKYVRTIITLFLYLGRLAASIGRADVVHIFTPGYLSFYLAPVPALLLARLLGKPAILNYHDGRAEAHLRRWPLARRLMGLAASIVTPSDYLAGIFGRFGLRATRIHNTAEEAALQYCSRPHPRPVFLHNRGLAPEYNPACTLRAFTLVQQRYPAARLSIAHDGPLRPALEELAASLGLRHTQFIGSVPPGGMRAFYDAADIYLMSPNADNMPLSVLECFAAGLPVVSSAAGGIPGLIEDGRTGLLFAPNDHRAMAACALRLLEEPGLASRLADNARAECAKYSWSCIGPQWIALYAHLRERSMSSV